MLAHGRTGFRIEAFKFAIYLSIPIIATQVFNNPDWTQRLVDYYKYVEYPPEDANTTQMKQDLEDLKKNLEQAKRKKMLMQRQLQSLDQMVEGTKSETTDAVKGEGEVKAARWWNIGSWFGRKVSYNAPNEEQH